MIMIIINNIKDKKEINIIMIKEKIEIQMNLK